MNNFANCYLLLAGFLLGSFFDPEDEGNMSLHVYQKMNSSVYSLG
jgi:hypothetical protein